MTPRHSGLEGLFTDKYDSRIETSLNATKTARITGRDEARYARQRLRGFLQLCAPRGKLPCTVFYYSSIGCLHMRLYKRGVSVSQYDSQPQDDDE